MLPQSSSWSLLELTQHEGNTTKKIKKLKRQGTTPTLGHGQPTNSKSKSSLKSLTWNHCLIIGFKLIISNHFPIHCYRLQHLPQHKHHPFIILLTWSVSHVPVLSNMFICNINDMQILSIVLLTGAIEISCGMT